MKYYTNLVSGAPESGISAVVEGTLLRIFFDYEKQTSESEDVEIDENAYVCENVDIDGSRDYGSIVSGIISSRYTNDDVTAIIANKALADDASSEITDEKRTEYLEDYSSFQNWRSHAKEIASKVIDILNA